MNFRRVPYRDSFLASWYLLWRSAATGVTPGLIVGAGLLWLTGLLAREDAVGYLRNFPNSKSEGGFWAVFILGYILFHVLTEARDWARARGVTYLSLALTSVGAALVFSSVATDVLPADPRLELAIVALCFGLGPALGILGGLTLLANGLINKEFASFRLMAIRKEGDVRIMRLCQTERLRVAWFLFWRGIGMGALVDAGFLSAIVVLLYPFYDTAAAHTVTFYASKASVSSGLLLSTLLVGFPLATSQLIGKTFDAGGYAFTFRLVRLKPAHRVSEEQQSRRAAG